MKSLLKKYFPFLKTIKLFIRKEHKIHYVKSYISFCSIYFYLLIYRIINRKIVAICMIEHIGDIIASEPISRIARSKYQSSKIIWFVRRPYVELLKYNQAIDKIIIVYCLSSWIWLKKYFRFEAIYELHFNGRFCLKCRMPLEKKIYNDSISGLNYYNFGGLLKAACLHNRIDVIAETPRIYIPQKVVYSVRKKNVIKEYFVIHCNSNETIRDWENEKWVSLINELIDLYKVPVIEVGIKSKLNLEKPLYYNYCGKFKLLETAELIKNATLFCGIDSAPAHMANASNIPGVILLGEYFGMRNYNPYSGNYGNKQKCRLVYSQNNVKEITVENVIRNFDNLYREIYIS